VSLSAPTPALEARLMRLPLALPRVHMDSSLSGRPPAPEAEVGDRLSMEGPMSPP